MTHPKNNILGRLGEVVDIGDEAINIIPGGGFGAGQTESLHHDARHCHDLRTGNTVPDGKWGTLAQSYENSATGRPFALFKLGS
jgi:hypothetical protein